jgi:C-terminal peptidase prc
MRLGCRFFLILFMLSGCVTTHQAVNGHDGGKEARAVEQAYRIIERNYVKPLELDQPIVNALTGMQEIVGSDNLTFTKGECSLVLSSSGQTMRIESILSQEKGVEELASAFAFVAATNPQCSTRALADAALRKMADLDRHSHFMPVDDFQEMTGKGVPGRAALGLEIAIDKDRKVRVVEPIYPSPAFDAGILPGDRLTMVNGRSTEGLRLVEVIRQLRGEEGTEVSITIERDGSSDPLVLRLKRVIIVRRDVFDQLLEKKYAYVRISRFDGKTGAEFDQTMKRLEQQTEEGLMGIILDLRDNAGGLLDEAVEVARRFIQSGVIVSLEGRLPNQRMSFSAANRTSYPYDLVVLVNEKTAAGSEIVAGSLQDHKRAIVVGTPTAKADSIQTLIPLNDGSALRITTAIWQLSRDISIEANGIVPDVVCENPFNSNKRDVSGDACIGAAIEILKRKWDESKK